MDISDAYILENNGRARKDAGNIANFSRKSRQFTDTVWRKGLSLLNAG